MYSVNTKQRDNTRMVFKVELAVSWGSVLTLHFQTRHNIFFSFFFFLSSHQFNQLCGHFPLILAASTTFSATISHTRSGHQLANYFLSISHFILKYLVLPHTQLELSDISSKRMCILLCFEIVLEIVIETTTSTVWNSFSLTSAHTHVLWPWYDVFRRNV